MVSQDPWARLICQDAVSATLRFAAHSVLTGRSSLTHSWLITGPAGSGRSNAALAFAQELLSIDSENPQIVGQQVASRSHPDLSVLDTQRVAISIDDVRNLVASSYFAPALSKFRIMIIEDADRMTARTANVLLKALEEPPETTIWILCAPHEADVLPTIRSRVRTLRLGFAQLEKVADFIVEHDNVDYDLAECCARYAQGHIGMARRLATDHKARERRQKTIECAFSLFSLSEAMLNAQRLFDIAAEDAKYFDDDRNEKDRAEVRRLLGVESDEKLPPKLRSQMRGYENEKKRKAQRSLRDGLDRLLIDIFSVYRDALMIVFGRQHVMINRESRENIELYVLPAKASALLQILDYVILTRERIEKNGAPLLALEALFVTIFTILEHERGHH